MSARVTAWAWEQQLPQAQKFLLLALSDQARSDGVVIGGAQADIAAMVGTVESTVRRNLKVLEDEYGLIRRWPQFEAGQRTPDLMMIAVDGTLDLPLDLSGGQNERAHHPSTPAHRNSSVGRDEGAAQSERLGERPDGIPDELWLDARSLLASKKKVGTRLVTEEEMAVAAAALAEFNRQAESDFGLGAHLRPLVGRIRDRPSWDAAKHVRLVQSAFRIRWWERSGNGRRPTPAVVYGNENVFEQVAQDAADEKQGRPVKDTPERRKRYTREDD